MNILQVRKYYLFNQKQMIEQAKFTYPPLGKASEKLLKTIEDRGEKQVTAIQNQGKYLNLIKVLTMGHIKVLMNFHIKE